ncbi:MAG: hypothetical protein EBZ48_05210 [Proteobacteria bacterium]|nr:hypothetical protein [Pseudomonadota bacterium]
MGDQQQTGPTPKVAAATTSAPSVRVLSDCQEQLLVAYYDRACGVFDSLRARVLLRLSPAARRFIQSVQQADAVFRAGARQVEQSCSVDLWDRIAARIEAERRAEVFLGERSSVTASARAGRAQGFSEWRARLAWGASGAAFASVCGVMLVYTGVVGGVSGGAGITGAQAGFRGSIPTASQVAFSPEDMRRVEPIEMDWMRSEGRVQMLHDPSERTSIIWVKPRSRSQVAAASETPQRLSRLSRSNSRIPVAIPAAGR